MSVSKVIFVAQKESFISRVLIKKIVDAGIQCDYVPMTIEAINGNTTDASLIVLYMEEGEQLEQDVLHFLTDVMEEKGLQVILVGGQAEIHQVCDQVAGNLIYKMFRRPVDNALFSKSVSEYFQKAAAGAFKKSILIVDDDPQYLTMVRQWLRDTYRVSMVNSGLQAIKWLGANKVDLILLDYEMPVTSGPQVLEMLRSDSETSSIPVMFLTGKGDKESVMAVVSLKPEGYFLKNIQQDELLAKLQEFFVLHKK